MSVVNKRGFTPIRGQVGGSSSFRSRLYEARELRDHPLSIGEPVTLQAGFVQRATAGSAAATNFIGVVKALYNADKRPLTHSLPTRAAYLNTSVAGWVEVYDDPKQAYQVQCVDSVGPSNIGGVAWIETSAVDSATGVTRTHVILTSVAGGTPLFRIIGLAPSELAVTTAGSPNNNIEVVPIAGLFN